MNQDPKFGASQTRRLLTTGELAHETMSPVRPHAGVAPVLQPAPPFSCVPVEQDESWTRLPRPGQRLCGLTRSHIYSLIARGLIRSVSIRQPHHKRGVRLVFRPSLHAFLAKLDAEQNGEGAK